VIIIVISTRRPNLLPNLTVQFISLILTYKMSIYRFSMYFYFVRVSSNPLRTLKSIYDKEEGWSVKLGFTWPRAYAARCIPATADDYWQFRPRGIRVEPSEWTTNGGVRLEDTTSTGCRCRFPDPESLRRACW